MYAHFGHPHGDGSGASIASLVGQLQHCLHSGGGDEEDSYGGVGAAGPLLEILSQLNERLALVQSGTAHMHTACGDGGATRGAHLKGDAGLLPRQISDWTLCICVPVCVVVQRMSSAVSVWQIYVAHSSACCRIGQTRPTSCVSPLAPRKWPFTPDITGITAARQRNAATPPINVDAIVLLALYLLFVCSDVGSLHVQSHGQLPRSVFFA
jgi:hypothetical protein